MDHHRRCHAEGRRHSTHVALHEICRCGLPSVARLWTGSENQKFSKVLWRECKSFKGLGAPRSYKCSAPVHNGVALVANKSRVVQKTFVPLAETDLMRPLLTTFGVYHSWVLFQNLRIAIQVVTYKRSYHSQRDRFQINSQRALMGISEEILGMQKKKTKIFEANFGDNIGKQVQKLCFGISCLGFMFRSAKGSC